MALHHDKKMQAFCNCGALVHLGKIILEKKWLSLYTQSILFILRLILYCSSKRMHHEFFVAWKRLCFQQRYSLIFRFWQFLNVPGLNAREKVKRN